jgi:hypothetical protein
VKLSQDKSKDGSDQFQQIISIKDQLDQLDSSLTNLFDSLNRPLVHENRFDLTQKINENFKDILGDVPGFMSVNEPANDSRDSYNGSENDRKYSMPNNSHA